MIFFEQKDFYSTSNEKNITDEEYTEVKFFFKIMKMKTLGDLNRIYNFQNVTILCEIFEKRATQLQNLFKYNPRKCNSASGFSGCVQRLQSKCVIALPTDAEIVRIFEKTLIGGYSCVNTRMAFDTEIFLKDAGNEKNLFKGQNNKLKRFSSKIIKMDGNNQYGMAMTKPLSYGCIKRKKKVLNFDELTELLKNVSLEDKIEHLFTVDIEFLDISKKTCLMRFTHRLF